jgi:hypothetical protein
MKKPTKISSGTINKISRIPVKDIATELPGNYKFKTFKAGFPTNERTIKDEATFTIHTTVEEILNGFLDYYGASTFDRLVKEVKSKRSKGGK